MRLLVFLGFLALSFLVPAALSHADAVAETADSPAVSMIDGNRRMD